MIQFSRTREGIAGRELLMPEVSRTEIGRRIYRLHQEKSVEEAVEKIRQKLGAEWKTFTKDEIHSLNFILGETWVFLEREVWEKIAFTKLSFDDIKTITRLGRRGIDGDITQKSAVEQTILILRKTL
jgi:hypothetical protein